MSHTKLTQPHINGNDASWKWSKTAVHKINLKRCHLKQNWWSLDRKRSVGRALPCNHKLPVWSVQTGLSVLYHHHLVRFTATGSKVKGSQSGPRCGLQVTASFSGSVIVIKGQRSILCPFCSIMACLGNTPVFTYIQKLLLKVQSHPVLFKHVCRLAQMRQ